MIPSSPHQNAWVLHPVPNPDAALRLFCFPYAGGNAAIFRAWPTLLPPEIDVCPIQLPGRSDRIGEPPFTWLPHLLAALLPALVAEVDRPFALFGHSMGAIIAYEAARWLSRQYDLPPVHLFVSARRAPHVAASHPPFHTLSPERFLQILRDLDGTPEAVLQDAAFMNVLLPLLRADFTLAETYASQTRHATEDPLTCPISAFGGTQDRMVQRAGLTAWREETSGPFRLHMLEGGHFFLHSQQRSLLAALAADLQPRHL